MWSARLCFNSDTGSLLYDERVFYSLTGTEFAPRISACKMSLVALSHSGTLLACSKSFQEVLTVAKKIKTSEACFWIESPLMCHGDIDHGYLSSTSGMSLMEHGHPGNFLFSLC